MHGGHVLKDDDPEAGVDNWAKTFERWEPPLPVLIENTAGGDGAMARRLDRMARLWEVLDDRVDAAVMARIGFCLDTCHAHAGGEELAGVVDRVKAITGRVDLVHANDSRDEFDSGADRHANFGSGQIDRATTWWRWCRRPGRRSSARRRAAPRARAPTSPGCGSACRPEPDRPGQRGLQRARRPARSAAGLAARRDAPSLPAVAHGAPWSRNARSPATKSSTPSRSRGAGP